MKSPNSEKVVPNYNAPAATYLVNPGTGYVFNAAHQYTGSLYSQKMMLDKNLKVYLNGLMQRYYWRLEGAVNNNYLEGLTDILKPGSVIDKQQRQFAKSMYAAGTKEQFGRTYVIDHVDYVSEKVIKIFVAESTSVTKKDGKTRTVNERWSYQAEKETNVWRMTGMSRW